jgi:hypothetical protein
MTVLVSMLVPATESSAAPAATIAIKDARVVAQGGALAVDLVGSCTNMIEFHAYVQATQQTARGVQHGFGYSVSLSCDGAPHVITVLIYPPPTLVPPETPHAVYETAWTTKPVLLDVQAGFYDTWVTADQVVPVHAAAPTSPVIAPRAAFKVNGSGLVVTVHVGCRPAQPPSPDDSYWLIVTATQVVAKHRVQQANAYMAALCDSTMHTYRVPFAAAAQPWNQSPAFVEADVCNRANSCPPYVRAAFRTVAVRP